MKITELLQINEMKNEFGEVIYSSFGTWKRAAKTANPDVWFDGDADICNAMVGPKPYKRLQTRAIGEWDGEQGVVFKSSVNEQQDVVHFYVDSERAYDAIIKKFGYTIDQDEDSGLMTAPREHWAAIEQLAHDAGGSAEEEDYGLGSPEHYSVREQKAGTQFKSGDAVTIKNAKKYDSMAAAGDVPGVVDFVWPDGRVAVKVKVGASTGQMNVDASDLVREGVASNYAEQLAQQIFDLNPNMDTSGNAGKLLKYAYSVAEKELGADRAKGFFRDGDFLGDFVSAYHALQKHGVAEDLSKRDQQDVAAIKAAIERLQAQLQQPNADKAAIQASIAHEKKRLALYGQDMSEAPLRPSYKQQFTKWAVVPKSKKMFVTSFKPDEEQQAKDFAEKTVGRLIKVDQAGREIKEMQEAHELGLDPDKRVVIKGVRGMKSTPFSKKFKNLAAYEAWLDGEEAEDYEIYAVMNESSVQQEAAYADDLDPDKPITVKGFRGMQSRPFKKRFKNMAAFEYWLEYDGDDVQSDSLEVTNESTVQQEAFDTPEFASPHEEAMFHLGQANDASATGDSDAYHMHMMAYHESMADHATDKGNSEAAERHTERASHHAGEAPAAVEPTKAEDVAPVKENKKELQLPILVSAAAKFTLMYHEANFILRSNGKRLAKMAAQSWQHMLDAVKNRTSATTEEGYSISLNGDSYAIADSAGNVLAQLTAADMDKLTTDSNIFLDTLSAAE